MIFQHTFAQVADGTKTVTRRFLKPSHVLYHDDAGMILAIGQKIPVAADADGLKHTTRDLWRVGGIYAAQPGRGKPALFQIEVISLRVERLQEITEEEAKAEGIKINVTPKGLPLIALAPSPCAADYLPEGPFKEMNNGRGPTVGDVLRAEYLALWDTIHRSRGERVADNPSVIRIEFARCPTSFGARTRSGTVAGRI